MSLNIKTILLIILLIGIPILIIIDSISLKWHRIKLNGETLKIQRLLKSPKKYNLSIDLNSWTAVQGYSRYGGTGYLLIIRFNNRDAYQIDSSYGLRQYEKLYRELNLKYKHLNDKN